MTLLNNAILGAIVGDALGVPVEFYDREILERCPVTNFLEFGTHNQPMGTWSDDSSLLLATKDGLSNGYDLKQISDNFLKWYSEEDYTPHGKIFDIGMTTRNALERLKQGCSPVYSGDFEECYNGNGSLMRILPLLGSVNFEKYLIDAYFKIREVSGITHSHVRSVLCCVYYLLFLENSKEEHDDKIAIYYKTNEDFDFILKRFKIADIEIKNFNRLLSDCIHSVDFKSIHGTGYVIQSLEASIYCFLTTNCYKEAVLKAVNLGDDTDTTGSITGGLAAYYYGMGCIPQNWIDKLVKKDYVLNILK